jgi:hypothetical protein
MLIKVQYSILYMVSNFWILSSTLGLGLKGKFSFSYFRENFAICFRFLRKKLTKIFVFMKVLRENFRFRESFARKFSFLRKFLFLRKFPRKFLVSRKFREDFPFEMLISIQEPPECVSRSETQVENCATIKIFREIFRESRNFSCKTFPGTKILRKNLHKNETKTKMKKGVFVSTLLRVTLRILVSTAQSHTI